MSRSHLLLLLASLGAFAAEPEYDPMEVLKRATEKVVASARSIPNYTCVETIDRNYFVPLAATLPRSCAVLLEERNHRTPDMFLRPYSTDRLRLDVTMASKGEMFSWAGANQFDEGGLDHVVRSGPVSTGSFAGYLKAVFEVDVKKLDFVGRVEVDQHSLMDYSFRVLQKQSHFRMKIPTGWASVGYSGTIYIDPATADVVRITIATDQAPPVTGMCQAMTTMDLTWVRLGDGHFLLPARSSQRFVFPTISETENDTVFSGCREFHSVSTLRFGDDEPGRGPAANNASAKSDIYLMPGLPFSFDLAAAIPTATAAGGDRFSGKLSVALRNGRGKILAPKGTPVEGRVMRVQTYAQPPEAIVVLRPEALRIGGTRVEFRALPDRRSEARRSKKKMEIVLPLREELYSGAFRFSGDRVVVPAGFRSEWRVVASDSGL